MFSNLAMWMRGVNLELLVFAGVKLESKID